MRARSRGLAVVFVIVSLFVAKVSAQDVVDAPPPEVVDAPPQAEAVVAPVEAAEPMDEASPSARVSIFDDGVGPDDVPWDDYEPRVTFEPRGLVHVGAQARLAALVGGADPLRAGPLVEVAAFVDVRFAARRRWRIRVLAVVSTQAFAESYEGGGDAAYGSPFGARLRFIPISADIGRFITFRVGGDVGFQYVPLASRGELAWFPAFVSELVGRAFEGRLEIGVVAGAQWTAVGRSNRTGDEVALEEQVVVGGVIGWSFR